MTQAIPTPETAARRRLFMVLSPRSLSYAKYALESLLRNAQERLHLHLITDSPADRQTLAEEMMERQEPGHHTWSVYAEEDLEDAAAAQFARFPHLRLFRHGHPCWRKITDPLLLSGAGEEMVLLDPDLYFPNRFRFEPTLDSGLLLMWQRPNCLLPAKTVTAALDQRIPLAHHVDIGVAHWRAPVDLEWLDWLIEKLGGAALPRMMHVEAIVWAAVAMRIGGGHLDPTYWHCWHRTQTKRVLRRFGAAGASLLRSEPFHAIKCFHAGGEAKSWIADAKEAGWMDRGELLLDPGRPLSFSELTPRLYHREQSIKQWLRRLGYYAAFDAA